jgi:hypothetical protein
MIAAVVSGLFASTAWTQPASAAPSSDAPSVYGSITKVIEPASGSVYSYISLTLNKTYYRPVSVYVYDCQRSDDTATLGTDLTRTAQWASFPVGYRSATVAVLVNGDADREKDEFTTYCLYSPDVFITNTGAQFGFTIGDEDTPRLVLGTQSVQEGTQGVNGVGQYNLVHYTVRLNKPAVTDSTVHYSVIPTSATAEFLSTQGSLTWTYGQSQKDITVWVRADNVRDQNPDAWVAFDGPVGINGAYVPDWHGDMTSWGKLLIVDDD